MSHQITLEDLGIIPKQIDRSIYAYPCGGCICDHCANNINCEDSVESPGIAEKEADFACFNCDDCYNYHGTGKGADNWKPDCRNYKVTNVHAEYIRKRFRKV